MKNVLPFVDWRTLLQRAPGFSSVLMDAICDDPPWWPQDAGKGAP